MEKQKELEFKKPKLEVNKLFNKSIVAMGMKGSEREEAERRRELQQPCSRKENLIISSLPCFLG